MTPIFLALASFELLAHSIRVSDRASSVDISDLLFSAFTEHTDDLPFDVHVKAGGKYPEYLKEVVGIIDRGASTQAALISKVYDRGDQPEDLVLVSWFGLWYGSKERDEVYECGLSNVRLTRQPLYGHADLFLLHVTHPEEMLTPLPAGAETVLWTLEPTNKDHYHTLYPERFNWTATYREESDVVDFWYGWTTKLSVRQSLADASADHEVNRPSTSFPSGWQHIYQIYHQHDFSTGGHKHLSYEEVIKPIKADAHDSQNQGKFVWWLVGNCNPAERNKRASEILRQAPDEIDVFGKCVAESERIWNVKLPIENSRPICSTTSTPHLEFDCLSKFASQYWFYLSFENTKSEWYMTEKFWRALLTGNVPVVFGARKQDYEARAPPNSFIFAEDFDSAEDLVSYLRTLRDNPALYNKFHEWRKEYAVHYLPEPLSLCLVADTIVAKKKLHIGGKGAVFKEWQKEDAFFEGEL